MAKKSEKGAKPRKAANPRKPTTRRRTSKAQEEVVEAEDMEAVEDEIGDHPEIEIEIEFDDDANGDADRDRRRRRGRGEFRMENLFGRDGPFGGESPFGADGPFGPGGAFGAGGPFGPGGVFGPGGLFGQGRGGRRRSGAGPRQGKFMGGMPQKKRARMFGPGELRLIMLAMFAEEPRHGYEFIKAMEEMTDGAYSPSPGIVYPTIQMLSDEGMIAEQESEDSRKLYMATDAGMAELEERKDELERLFERLGRKADRARSGGASPDIFRALGNLASVITNRASDGKMNTIDKDKVVDLIDELARRIERL